jgi:hypothetical protein
MSFIFALLVIAAWGSLFIPLSCWAKGLLSFGFLCLGIIFLLFGLGGWYWDSYMSPGSSSPATALLVTGVLLLLSRATSMLRLVFEILFSPPMP